MGGVFQFCLYCNKDRTFGKDDPNNPHECKEENVKSAEIIKVIDMLSPILYPSFIAADQYPFGKTHYRTRLISLYETIREDQILDNDKENPAKFI